MYLIALTVIILGCLIGGSWWWLCLAWPKTRGTLSIAGLHDVVKVLRDKYGIPSIYAKNIHDLFFAQGYIHAQDRLWQMDLQRRMGLGRLSEFLGKTSLENDRYVRTLGIHRSALQDMHAINDETRAVLDAYTMGVNAYINSHQKGLPLEYRILRVKPLAWEPVHTLVWLKMMQWYLNENWNSALLREKLASSLNAEVAAQMMSNGKPGDARGKTIRQTMSIDSNQPSIHIPLPDQLSRYMGGISEGLGSNAWVVGPARTDSGRPLLANDPHLGFSIPNTWYEMSLHAPNYHCVGATLPGVFGCLIGHNEQITWGITNLPAETQDLYMERLNPENPDEYEVNGRYEPFEIIQEEIACKGRSVPTVITIKLSRHGPLVNDIINGLDQPVAFKWLATSRPSTLINALLPLNQAQNWQDFTDALRQWDMPMHYFVYADCAGHIGCHTAGLLPQRASRPLTTPIPGWNDDYEWGDPVPFEQLPHAFDPPEAIIVVANNHPVSEHYPYFLGHDWAAPYRAERIHSLLTARYGLTLQDMIAVQCDDYSLPAARMVPYFLAVSSDDPLVKRIQVLLENWDAHLSPESCAAGIFEVTYWHLVQILLQDKIDVDIAQWYLAKQHQHIQFIERLLEDPESPWWSNEKLQLASRDEMLEYAMKQSLQWWLQHHGSIEKKWCWGKIHTATFQHSVFGSIPLLNLIFNDSVGPVAGDAYTPLANSFWFGNSFQVLAGPVYRQIIDVGQWENSIAIMSGGQSGHALHPHIHDMTPLWKRALYHPMCWEQVDHLDALQEKQALLLYPISLKKEEVHGTTFKK